MIAKHFIQARPLVSCSPCFSFIPKNEIENLRSRSEAELNSRLESKTKEFEKIVMENERLRRALKRVSDLFPRGF